MKKYILVFILFLSVSAFGAKTYTIKMATIAPDGSTWMNELYNFRENLKEQSNGQINFKIYAGGIMGGEKDMLRKMKLGQIDAAGFTGVGLGEVVPEVRVLELPFLFKNSEEVDYVFEALFDDFYNKFLDKGYYFVAWAEVGFVYLFTKSKVQSQKDLQNVKMWLWKDDPLANTIFKIMNIPAVPLDVTDVYTSLQTKLIDGFYISPYGAIAMQWFTKTNYILNYPLTHSLGGVLMTKRKMESLPEDLQKMLIENTKTTIREIVIKGRKDNIESMKVLQENGQTLVTISDETKSQFNKYGKQCSKTLTNKLYSQEILNKVNNLLQEYRELNK